MILMSDVVRDAICVCSINISNAVKSNDADKAAEYCGEMMNILLSDKDLHWVDIHPGHDQMSRAIDAVRKEFS